MSAEEVKQDTTPLVVQAPRIIKTKPAAARLVVVETVYHQGVDSEPTAFETRYSRRLVSQEQSMRRSQIVGVDWTVIEAGWVPDPSMFKVEAPITHFLLIGIDTPAGIVELGTVLPGEDARFTPFDVKRLRLRSPSGTCRCVITLVPR